jgi:hypothetical protein
VGGLFLSVRFVVSSKRTCFGIEEADALVVLDHAEHAPR